MLLPGALEHLYSYWKALPRAGNSLIPARFNMLPTDLKTTVPKISLLRFNGRFDVQICTINTGLNTGWSTPFIGMNAFDLIAHSMRENAARLYEAVLQYPCAGVMHEQIITKNGNRRRACSLYLPLANIRGEPGYIISCTDYDHTQNVRRIKTEEKPRATHDHMISLDLMDIGGGIPDIEFETIVAKTPPKLSHHWWDRFIPTLPSWLSTRPVGDYRSPIRGDGENRIKHIPLTQEAMHMREDRKNIF